MRKRKTSRPIYRVIEEYLRGQIDGRPELTPLPSQNELSRRFRANHLTVRRALQELESEGFLKRIQGKGTFVRKPPVAGQPFSVAMIIPSQWRENVSVGGMVEGMVDYIAGRSINLSLFPYSVQEHYIHNAPKPESFQAVICVIPDRQMYNHVKQVFHRGRPILIINRIVSDPLISYVSTDHAAGAREAVAWLIRRGHRRIGFVGTRNDGYAVQRYQGYVAALTEADMRAGRSGAVACKVSKVGDELLASLRKRCVRMLESFRPTAVFVLGASYMPAVLAAASETGRCVPGDLEIATYDELSPECPEKPYIHEIKQPYYKMGSRALEELERIRRGEQKVARVLLAPTCIMKNVNREEKEDLLLT